MTTFEILISFLGSGIFLGILGMFYRMGSHHKEIELCFKHIDDKFLGVESKFTNIENNLREIRDDIKEMRKDISRLDREVGIITATLRFNGFDLDRHKAEGE